MTGNASDPFWISLRCGAEAAARRAGVELSWSASTTADATVLAQNLKTQTLKRPDGVVVAPFASSAFVSPVRRLMRDGVPVAVVGGADLTEPVHYQAFRTSPRISFASLAALTAEQVPGAGKLGILGGLPGIDLEAVARRPVRRRAGRGEPRVGAFADRVRGVRLDQGGDHRRAPGSSPTRTSRPSGPFPGLPRRAPWRRCSSAA